MHTEKPIRRQAVVVIHGIGEQRPMETLRKFVAGVKQKLDDQLTPGEQPPVIRSKPDSIGDIYETVRLSMSGSRRRPKTDFYEFYWAHNMRDSRLSHMTTWLGQLIFRSPSRVPKRLRKVFYTVRTVLMITVAAAVGLAWFLDGDAIQTIIAGVSAGVGSLVVWMLVSWLVPAFLAYAGDAGRYFTPDPGNVEERSRIRAQGIKFLKKLHEIQSVEKVDRIIIVAHSLGSVIAYDLMRLLWTEFNDGFEKRDRVSQAALKKMAPYLGRDSLTPKELAEFRQLQVACWNEQRALGNKWLISDFITIGAALHALDYFMVSSESTADLITQRELPVCPPIRDAGDNKIYYRSDPYLVDGARKMQVKVLHHGALFAVTRWTNIYYESDFIGGDMRRVFGCGIRDITIPRKSFSLIPGGHTCYWRVEDDQNALRRIVAALDLNCDTRSSDAVKPRPKPASGSGTVNP